MGPVAHLPPDFFALTAHSHYEFLTDYTLNRQERAEGTLHQSTKSGLSTKGNAAFANDKNANLQQLRPYFRLIGKNWWFA